ncbi:tyrosine-type recombinase/integrase [Pseudomonadota bacterium]
MNNQIVTVDFRRKNSEKMTETLKVDDLPNRSRTANDQARGRKHLSTEEVDRICKTLRKRSRYPDRDELMVLMTFFHGFRATEVCRTQWQHIQLRSMQLKVKRLKNGIDTTHPIANKRELMLLRRLHREQKKPSTGYVFKNERGSAVSVNGFQQMFGKYSKIALGVQWNVHGLRHGCATILIDRGHDLRTVQVYMGHRNIQNTTVYLHESVKQFEKIEW